MATLDNKVKAFIVHGLATYLTPSEVAEAVKVEFDGLEVSRQQISCYNPNTVAGSELSQKWRDAYAKWRKEFNENIESIPIANKAYRLKLLDDMTRDALKSKNRPLAASLVEQAAKEMGEVFTNKHKVDNISSDGSMASKPAINLKGLSDEQLRALNAIAEQSQADSGGTGQA